MEGFPPEVMTEPRPESSMALTQQGGEGGTSHGKERRCMGRGVTALKKREVVTGFLILQVSIFKWYILDLDHSPSAPILSGIFLWHLNFSLHYNAIGFF